MNKDETMMNNNIKCPKCNSDNVQTEGVLHDDSAVSVPSVAV